MQAMPIRFSFVLLPWSGQKTINHCEYFVQTFKDLAAKSQELAQLHDQMAKDAEQK
jgi:hypothetical protein